MYRGNDELLDVGGEVLHQAAPARTAEPRPGSGAKRVMDVVGALAFFVLFLPLLIIVAIGVRLSSKGSILYAQERVGLEGRTFRFYKFRSMLENSEEVFRSFLDGDPAARAQWEKYQKLDNDPRITPFGSFIRKTSLDELPQFWNVLKGEMSLVGPRPVTPSERARYGQFWSSYCAVRPGLTGIWQVSGRSDVTYEQRVQMDHLYATSWSVDQDLRILLKTVKVVIWREGSK